MYHIDSYIYEIKTAPDLQVIVGYKDIFEEYDRLLQLKTEDPIPLYYDTTFCLGDFYVSTLAFQHIMFEESPVMPLAFMVHERKFQKCHEQFLDLVKTKIPRLEKKNVPIITDREAGIVNAFTKMLPNSQLLICWNHILRDLKFWLSKHGGTVSDMKAYDINVRQLLQCETRDEFDSLFEKLKIKWSEPMVDYFEQNIYETITKYAARRILEKKTDLYSPYSGVTNNCSESINAKLKRLTEWKEREVDNIVLYLHYMQSNDVADLMKSFCGVGEWSLLRKYKFALKAPETVVLPKRVCHPDKIIEMIKGDIEAIELERKSLCDLQAEVNEQSDDFLEKGNSSNETEGKPTSIPKENVPSKNRREGQNSLEQLKP